MSKEFEEGVYELLKSIDCRIERIAMSFEALNKLILDFIITMKAEKIVQEIKDDGLRVVEEVKPIVRKASPGFGFEEKEEPTLVWEMEYEGKQYKNFKPCKYKCGYWTGWGKPYEAGKSKTLHIHPGTKEIIGFDCPKFKEDKGYAF